MQLNILITKSDEMIRVALVGCGKIAEAHCDIITRLPDSKIVAVCDLEELMARQMAERFKVESYFDNLDLMLRETRPDVVHITTPPQSHYEVAKKCLQAGCHIFIEKPFTVHGQEIEELINLAESKNLKLTVGTDEQFSSIALEMRNLIAKGWLGGRIVHMEVYYCYDLGDERYALAFLKNRSHWLWQLPGQLIQNIIPHAVIKISEFLEGEKVKVIAEGFTSNFLKNLGESHLKDELRVIVVDGNQTTAYLTFSTQMRPALRQFRIFGSENGLLLDQDHHALIRLRGKNYVSYVDKFVPLNYFARQYRKNMLNNVRLFLKRQFQMKRGLYNLIRLFYQSIENDSAPPIPYNQILLCSRIIDSIILQLYPDKIISSI